MVGGNKLAGVSDLIIMFNGTFVLPQMAGVALYRGIPFQITQGICSEAFLGAM
jgi:hypothetical protein